MENILKDLIEYYNQTLATKNDLNSISKNEDLSNIEERIKEYLAETYDLSVSEFDKIWEKAYNKSYKFGISSIVDTFEELADLYNDLLEER